MEPDLLKRRSIIHCDMDAFYASVEQLVQPDLKGRPVVVGGSPQSRGVVSTCSYEARKYGVRSAMPLAQAYRLCPQAVFLPPNFPKYQEISEEIHKIFAVYTPLIEPLSLDEAFLDVTGSESLFGPALEIARQIKQRVKNELDLHISIGVAHNKFLAKLASELSKPNGLLAVDPDRVQEFLDPLDIYQIWGVGRKTAQRLYEMNIKTVKDLRRLEPEYLDNMLGKAGRQLYLLARGIDERPVETWNQPKSIGRETTFAVDLADMNTLEKTILDLAVDVGRSLRREGLKGRTVTIKVRYGDFKTHTRSYTLESPTDLDNEIYNEARRLLKTVAGKPIRLLGVSIHNLTEQEAGQLSLFAEPRREEARLYQAVDKIRDKYGSQSITRARLINPKEHPKR